MYINYVTQIPQCQDILFEEKCVLRSISFKTVQTVLRAVTSVHYFVPLLMQISRLIYLNLCQII